MIEVEQVEVRYASPPMFALLELQFAAAVGYLMSAVPYWLSLEGQSLATIGLLAGTANFPHVWKLLWCPLIDLSPYKRVWYGACAVGTALLLVVCSSLPNPGQNLPLYTLLLAGLQGTAATAHAALNGLMASTTRKEDKGRTGGWQMAGNVGGTSLLGTLAIFLASRLSRPLAGVVLAGIVLLTSAGIFWIPARGIAASAEKGLRRWGHHVKAIGADLWSVLKSSEGRTGLFILLMPIGAGALTNIFSGMATSYSASQRTVELVNGIGMGLTGAAGSLVGGFIADKLDRRVAYVLAGGVTALCALGMAAGPLTPTTYAAGILAYSFANGIAFASFAGFVLQIVGSGAAVTTKYTLFVATSNFAISYTTAFAGYGSQFRNWGARGSLLFDAAQTFAGIVLVTSLLLFLRFRGVKTQPAVS